jgi:Alginate export
MFMKLTATAALLASATAAHAATEPDFKPIIDMRLRYEGVEQAGFAKDADALTMRVRAGFDLKIAPATRILVEAEGLLGISNNYNSTTNGNLLFPVVADPQTIEFNRLQIQNKSLPNTTLTAGRQRINLDDQRFVGSVAFRQNEQTFDAFRIETSPVKNLRFDVTYAWSNRTIFGLDSPIAHIDGDNVFAQAVYVTPIGTLTGFGYWVDQDAPTRVQFSSATYGGRFVGKQPFSKTTSLAYILSYAHQEDAFENPRDYSADYYLAEATLNLGGAAIGGGYEVLGASSGAAFTSFQTPLATLHKFQGFADKFLTTPGNGIRDAYGSAGYTVKNVGPFDSIAAIAVYHDFQSDRASQHYGSEINLRLTAKIARYLLELRYADYSADSFAVDTRKLWLSVDYVF